MKLEIKNRSKRFEITWPRSGCGNKYTKHKMCISIMIVIYIKQHLSNIYSTIYNKVKALPIKKVCI